MGIEESHFSHVFIDETGHGMEPECLVAIAGLLGTTGQLVLVGHPKQLGPVLKSPVAIKVSWLCGYADLPVCGLDKSHWTLWRLVTWCQSLLVQKGKLKGQTRGFRDVSHIPPFTFNQLTIHASFYHFRHYYFHTEYKNVTKEGVFNEICTTLAVVLQTFYKVVFPLLFSMAWVCHF